MTHNLHGGWNSHGLGGDTGGGTAWGSAWAASGIAVIHVQHHGSDTAVYAGAPTPADIPARVRAAASGQQLLARVGDVRWVLDETARRSREGACDLTRLDLAHVGIAGHSMGAWTAQAIAGQYLAGASRLIDRRFRAAIAFSPSAPDPATADEAFGRIAIPFLSITGDEDGMPATAAPELRAAAAEQRTAPYRAMPPGQKYLLVFAGADHMVFSGNSRRAERPADAHVKAVTIAATTAFWRATLLDDAKARAYLSVPDGLQAALAPGDSLAAK